MMVVVVVAVLSSVASDAGYLILVPLGAAAFAAMLMTLGFVLVLMTIAMNGLAIWLRYRLRRNIKW